MTAASVAPPPSAATDSAATDVATAALATQVARLFFDRQLTKVEIAARLGISRFRVARLIDRALADGAVRIEFRDAPQQERQLAATIEQQFGLDLCVVAATPADDAIGLAPVATLAADVVDGLLRPGDAIGIAWGSTVAAVVAAMRPRTEPSIDVVQLAGSSETLGSGTDPGDLTRVLADRVGGRAYRLHAPTFVDSVEARSVVVRQAGIAATMAHFRGLSVALVGIGALAPAVRGVGGNGRRGARDGGSSLVRSGALAVDDVASLVRAGAVGDLVVHPFGADGRFLSPGPAERAIAISVDELRSVERVVAVAAGAGKSDAIRAALRTGVVRILITDSAAARAIVAGDAAAARRGRRRGRP